MFHLFSDMTLYLTTFNSFDASCSGEGGYDKYALKCGIVNFLEWLKITAESYPAVQSQKAVSAYL